MNQLTPAFPIPRSRSRHIGEIATTSGVWVCIGCFQEHLALSAGEAFPPCRVCQSLLGWEPESEAAQPDEPAETDRSWRGVFGDVPTDSAVVLPTEAILPPARPTVPNLSWLPERGERDE
jgi:hypothetical protein